MFDVAEIGFDVAAGQRVRVGVVVVGDDAEAAPLEGVAHPRCAAEEIEHCRPRCDLRDNVADQVEQQPLGAEVLDHRCREA